MKRYIRSNSIFAMADARKHVLEKLDSLNSKIEEHVLKCVVYGHDDPSYEHWIHEITNWISYANDVTLKPNNKKPKASDFLNTVFSFGDDISDAKLSLGCFQAKIHDSDKYSYFEVTDVLARNLLQSLNNIVDTMIPIVTKDNNLRYSQIKEILKDCIVC